MLTNVILAIDFSKYSEYVLNTLLKVEGIEELTLVRVINTRKFKGEDISREMKLSEEKLKEIAKLDNSFFGSNAYNMTEALLFKGEIYFHLNEHKKATESYHKAMQIAKNSSFLKYIANACEGLSRVYEKTGNPDSALIYYNKSIDIAFSTDDKYGLSLINGNIAEIYLKQQNYNRAFENAGMALKYSQAIGSLEQIYSNYNLLSRIYKELGDSEA